MQWDLSVFYKGFDDPRIQQDIQKLEDMAAATLALFQAPGDAVATLEQYVDLVERCEATTELLGMFAQLTLSCEATNEPAAKLMDRLMELSVRLTLGKSAAERYIGALGKAALEDAIAGSEKLQSVAFAPRKALESAEHAMNPDIEEWMLKMSLTGAEAFAQLRDKLDATLLVDYRGEKIPLSAARNKAYDADADVRRDAYEAELAAYKKFDLSMAAALGAIKGEALTMIEAKRYGSVLEQTLASANMDRETLDAMLSAIRESLPAFRKYLRKKGELLGHTDGLPFYDLFAPVVKGDFTPKTYTVEEAREKLCLELGKFSPDMAAFIDHAFKNGWIDMFPAEGKSGGAFCAGSHGLDISRILTNFDGSHSDVCTLAHELGHAWHNRCMKGLPFMLTDTPMPLAETASIFNETLLSHAVRAQAGKAELFTMLESEIQDATQVIVDIYSRFLFESAVVEGRKTHVMSVNELCAAMLDAQEQSYGDGLDKNLRHPYMWACKSHYYYPGLHFYNFPYAFGLLFGKGVFAQYLEQGADFVPTYNQLLRSCGSDKVADVAASVGIDVRSVDFWRASLKVITDDIDLFIKLADEE